MKKFVVAFICICLVIISFIGCTNVGINNDPSVAILKDKSQMAYRMGKISWYIYNYMKMNPKYAKQVGDIERFYTRLTSTNDVPSTEVLCEMITNIAVESLASESNTMERILIMEAANYATAIALQKADTNASDEIISEFIRGIEDGKKVYVYEDLYEKEIDAITTFECNDASPRCEFSNYRIHQDVMFQDATAKKLLTYKLSALDKEELEDFRLLMRSYHDKGVGITKITIDAAVIEGTGKDKAVTKLIFILDTGAEPYDVQIAQLEEKIANTTDELSLERLNASLKAMKEEKELGIDPKYVEYSCISCVGDFPHDKKKKK